MLNLIAKDLSNNNLSTCNLHIFDMVDLLVKKYNYQIIDINLLYHKKINKYFQNIL